MVLNAGDLNKLAEGQRGYSDSTIYQKNSKEEIDDEVRSAGLLGQVGDHCAFSNKIFVLIVNDLVICIR